MAVYKVKTEADRERVLRDIGRAPLLDKGFQVKCERRKRSDEQNDMMWDLLRQFSKQATINGAAFNVEAWKAIFMNALGYDSDMLPTLDGKAFFAEGYRSSELSVEQMSALIERIFQEGAERGVKFRQNEDRELLV